MLQIRFVLWSLIPLRVSIQVKKAGIQNVLALRGDPPEGQDTFTAIDGGFACALDLIKHIQKEYGDYFGIGIAGYPEAHPDSIVDDEEKMKENYWRDIHYLKQKVRLLAMCTFVQVLFASSQGMVFVP